MEWNNLVTALFIVGLIMAVLMIIRDFNLDIKRRRGE